MRYGYRLHWVSDDKNWQSRVEWRGFLNSAAAQEKAAELEEVFLKENPDMRLVSSTIFECEEYRDE